MTPEQILLSEIAEWVTSECCEEDLEKFDTLFIDRINEILIEKE